MATPKKSKPKQYEMLANIMGYPRGSIQELTPEEVRSFGSCIKEVEDT
ncbi:hypothetical protein [Oceanotoga phage vB_OteS-UFV02]